MSQEFIKIRGARVHNLKNVSLDIPKNKLVVITGLSGSGKSSLAFDTIYAEGQRRYVESLSAYARQFLGVMDKPDVDRIEGLSPAIAIDQRSVSRNPRSTVGTITEVYDYLRLLFARIGRPICPHCQKIITRQSASQIVDQILKLPAGQAVLILAPLVRGKKGEHRGFLEQAQRAGFMRVRINSITYRLEEVFNLVLNKQKKHNIEIVVDETTVPAAAEADFKDERARILDSVETALKVGQGLVVISKKLQNNGIAASPRRGRALRDDITSRDIIFSEKFACQTCGWSLAEIEPRLFSFNSPFGACPECQGLGTKLELNEKLVIPNLRLTLAEGAIRPWATASHRVGRQGYYYWKLSELAVKMNFSFNTPVGELSKKVWEAILNGQGDFEGVIPNLQRRWKETDSEFTRAEIEKYMVIRQCPVCRGQRLRPEARAIKVTDKSIDQIADLSISASMKFFDEIKLSASENKIARPIIQEILKRLQFLLNVGLDYLTVSRGAITLSGGEAQRIKLATQIGSGLAGVIYILDEPSIGLHQRDMGRLIATLKSLRDLGNTVVVVEHDAQTILEADWVVDVGPGAGEAGGKIIFTGTPAQLLKSDCLTGQYLAGKKKVCGLPTADYGRKEKNKEHLWGGADPSISSGNKKILPERSEAKTKAYLEILGATEHNLKNIDVKIPLQKFVAITGVSGSGKSTLVNDILGWALARDFHGAQTEPGAHQAIVGAENLDKVIVVDQSPIGRTPRSNPATYTGAFTPIRDLFAATQEARVRGYQVGRFSFNVKGGRCEVCEGDGVKKIEMYFLRDIYIECEECHGQRYNKDVLEIEYKGKNISQALNMTVGEAMNFFENIPILSQKLGTLQQVGLGYMKLGQSSITLSGGEAQRI
ncbi:MAG: excinuclease ABC subunit UvrA, partial [Patescibacteria group bacterium]